MDETTQQPDGPRMIGLPVSPAYPSTSGAQAGGPLPDLPMHMSFPPSAIDKALQESLTSTAGAIAQMQRRNDALDRERPTLLEDAALAILTHLARPGRQFDQTDISVSFEYAEEFVAECNRRRIEKGADPADAE